MRSLTSRQTLVILTGLNLFNYIDRYVLSAVLPSVQRDLNLNDEQGGLLSSFFMLGYFVTSPVFGWLGDRSSRKWLIASGIFIWSVATVLTGFAGSLVAMLIWRVFVGVGEASYATISPAWLSDVYPPKKRNNALTIFYTAIPVGAALGYILGGWIESHQGWRHAFFWVGAPGLLLALTLLPFREPERVTDNRESSHKLPGWKDIANLFRLRDYNLSVWGYTAYTFALGAMSFWGPTFIHRVHGLQLNDATNFLGKVTVAAGLVGTMAGGFAATAWQKRSPGGYAGLLALSMLAGAPLAFAAFTAGSANVSMACLAAAMFCVFLGTGPINTLILESAPVALRASAMAGSIFVIHLFGDMLSPAIVGSFSKQWNNLQKALLILPAFLLLAGVLWGILYFLQKRTPKAVL